LERTRTSEILEDLVSEFPHGSVDLEWLLGRLDKHSFGLLLLLLGLLVIIPGIATIATLAIIFPSFEMVLGLSRPSFPRFLEKRPFDFERFKRLTLGVLPVLRALENAGFHRRRVSRDVTHRLVGLAVFLLALSAIWPLPLVNVIPGIAIVFVSIAYLQEDSLLLGIAAIVVLASLLGFGFTFWKAVGALAGWISHLL